MSPLTRVCLRDHCVAIAVCVCVTFQLVHVVIEKVNASHTHAILIALYQVYVPSASQHLSVCVGLYGIVNTYAEQGTQVRQRLLLCVRVTIALY